MNYTLRPSLEHISAVRTAIALWGTGDIRNLIAKFYPSFGKDEKEWQKIEDKVIKKLPNLPLPELLKEKVSDFIKPVGFQILRWQKHHDFLSSDFIKDSLSKLHWTAQGIIDQKKTAEMLVKDEDLHVVLRYKLACIYCLEDFIYPLYEQLDKFQRKKLSGMRKNESALVPFWSHYIEGRISELESTIKEEDIDNMPFEYAFQHAAVSGNKAGTDNFLKKLTPEEKERVLVKTAGDMAESYCRSCQEPREHHVDVLCFLLTNMSEEQRVEVFRRYPRHVLECFLEWPWQNFFMKTAEHTLGFLSKRDYDILLCTIIEYKIVENYKDYDYRKLFRAFWQQSPSTHKEYAVFQGVSGMLMLSRLFEIGDEENIKLIFMDSCITGKKELISCGIAQDICKNLVRNEMWDLLEFFIEECVPCKDIIIKLKEEFKELIRYTSPKKELVKTNEKRDKFCQLLNDFTEISNKKRNMEESDCPSKKLCSVGCEKIKEEEKCLNK